MVKILGGQRPAYEGECEEQEERGQTDGAEDTAFAEECDAGFAVGAEKDDDESDGGPGKAGRQAGVMSDERHEILRRLPGGEPPGKNGSDTGNDDKAEKLSREPAFNFLARLASDKIIPHKQADGDGSPSIDRCLVGKPQPCAEVDCCVVAGGQARQ